MELRSTEALVIRCRQTLPGDTRAFEALVAAWKGRVFAITYRLMGDPQEAEDQAQEVFLKVYRGLPGLAEPATFPAWITRIATNTCLDALSQRRRRPQTMPLSPQGEDEPGARLPDTRTPAPEEIAEQREVRRCLEETLSRLEPEVRAMILLRDIEDRPYQEIAATLAIGLSAVKMRVHRARMAFQQVLRRVCPGVAPVADSR